MVYLRKCNDFTQRTCSPTTPMYPRNECPGTRFATARSDTHVGDMKSYFGQRDMARIHNTISFPSPSPQIGVLCTTAATLDTYPWIASEKATALSPPVQGRAPYTNMESYNATPPAPIQGLAGLGPPQTRLPASPSEICALRVAPLPLAARPLKVLPPHAHLMPRAA